VIDEKSPTLSVFIEVDEIATNAMEMFSKMIRKEILQEDFSPYKKTFHQHIIAIPCYLDKALDLKRTTKYSLCEGIYFVPNTELLDFYNLETGFIRTKENKGETAML
jgi:hypothetical protein